MSKGPWKRELPKPEEVDKDLARPYPLNGKEDRKVLWHLRQFYALRAKALEGAKGVHTAIIAQKCMLEIDLELGMRKPDGIPNLPMLRNGRANHVDNGGLDPVIRELEEPDTLRDRMARSAEGAKPGDEGEGE